MTVDEILVRIRAKLDDAKLPYLWSDEELVDDYLNSAIDELCEECFLIEEAGQTLSITGASNISFTAATKRITKASGGFVAAGFYIGNKITISGTTSNNGVKTVVAVTDTDITVSESLTDESNKSAVITATTTICRIPVIAATAIYSVSSTLVRVKRALLASQTTPLTILRDDAIDYLDYHHSGWESADSDTPKYLITTGIGTDKVRLWPTPLANDTMNLIVFRRPASELSTNDMSVSPEIAEHYHKMLYDGVLWQAYSKQDADTTDTEKAEKHRKLWSIVKEGIKRRIIRSHYHDEVIAPLTANI